MIIGQVARLHQAKQAAQQSEQARRDRRDYAQQDQQPFAWLRAEAYFLLRAGAARQLVRALAAYGDTKNVPAFVPGRVGVRCQATGSASVPVLSRVAHRGQHCGAVSMLAGVLPVDDLVAWAHEIQAYLLQAEREWR